MMIDTVDNIWSKLNHNSSKRIDMETPFNFFWIKDLSGKYGFHVKFDKVEFGDSLIENLKGIKIITGFSEALLTDFVLWLNNKTDWQLFRTLCNDILATSIPCTRESELIRAIDNRLKKWKKFLQHDNSFAMSEKKQMGLFGELQCLKNIILPAVGIKQALISWVGPDYDKQDFSLPNISIEVKSYISSHGPIVKISSAYQLLNEIKPLYLFAFGLTRNETGLTIVDLINELTEIILSKNGDIDTFEQKLSEYGYIIGLTIGPFTKFSIDHLYAFMVNDDFPKIIPGNINSAITSIEYSIDLSKCSNFKVDPYTLIK